MPKVNTDENQEWAGRYGIQGIPTMLFVAEGKVLHRQVGAVPEGILREVIGSVPGSSQIHKNDD